MYAVKKQKSMQIKKIKIIGIILVTALLAVSGFALVSAQEGSSGTYSETGTSQSATCRGGRDFQTTGITIWNQFIDPADFSEYWKDITVRYWENICLYEDIYSLVKRTDGAAEQLRKAFYVCGDIERPKKTYYSLETELYFIRHYVDFIKAKDVSGNELAQYFLRPIDDDWFDFTEEYYSQNEQLAVFTKFSKKYANKLETYTNCTDPGIENFVKRVKEDIEYLKNTVKDAGESIKKSAKKLGESSSGLWDSVSSGEYFTNMVDVRINGLPCPIIDYATEKDPEKKAEKAEACLTGINAIAGALEDAVSFGSGVTFEQLGVAAEQVRAKALRLNTDADAMAEYEYLYLEGSDDMTKQMAERLDALKNILSNTTPYLNQTIRCAGDVPDSQCKNK